MPRTRSPYSPEFRRQMVDLVRAGRSPEDLSREFEPTAQSISTWVAQADKQEGPRFASQAEARTACFSFIEGWYNPVRLHSALGYRSPMAYEAAAEAATAEP